MMMLPIAQPSCAHKHEHNIKDLSICYAVSNPKPEAPMHVPVGDSLVVIYVVLDQTLRIIDQVAAGVHAGVDDFLEDGLCHQVAFHRHL